MVLKLLITLAARKGVQRIQIFGVWQVVIKWIKGEYKVGNYMVTSIFDEIKLVFLTFNQTSLKHMYKKRIKKAEALPK